MSNKSKNRESEASFYSLYTAGSSLSIDLDIWEHEVVDTGAGDKRKYSRSSGGSRDESEKHSKASNNSYNEFCKDTLTWLEEDVFCAPKATADNFEDDEIVSSFSKFNQLMEKLKDTKMSDLSDFDDRPDDRDNNEKAAEEKTEVIKTRSSSDSSCSNSSSGDQACIIISRY